MAAKKGICMRTGRFSIQRCVATGSIYGSQRGRLNFAMFITASVLLECPLWSSGFQIPFTRVSHGVAARPFSSTCLPCRFRDPRYKRARQVAVECNDGERRRGDTPVDSPLPETRPMKWDDDAPRGTSNALDEKKSLRIAQLRAELQDFVRAEEYAEAAILQEQIQALERTVARQSFDQTSSITRQATSSALVVEDESMLSRSRGPMQRRPSRTLQRELKPVLTDRERTREDEQSDALFYKQPRMVTHVDLKFALRLQQLYQKRLLPGSAVLDLGASCVSYLPEGVVLRDVVGLGMNMQELEANEDLTKRIVHDLNAAATKVRPQLPFEDEQFDAVVCASAIQYFTQPEVILAEASRVLRTGGIMVIAFTDKCLASKVLLGWKERGNLERTQLVMDLVRSIPTFTTPELIWEVHHMSAIGQLVPSVRDQVGGDPFMAIVAYKGSPPAGWMMQVEQTNGLGPFQKLTPFAAMFMLYLVITHGMP